MTTSYTAFLRLAKPEFRSPTWSALMNGNMDSIDAGITNALVAANIDIWANATEYGIGVIRMDDQSDPPTFWINTEEHTSPVSPTTFAQDRVSHTDRWSSLTFGITPRGEWDNDTNYGYYDIAYDNVLGIIGLCLIPHTSNASGDIQDDAANWVFIVDLPSVGTTPAINVSFDNTTASLPGAPTNVQTALNAVDSRIDSAATIVAGLDSDLDALTTTVGGHTTTLSSLSGRMTTAENDITAAEATIVDHESRIDDLETTVAGLGIGFPAGTAMLFWQASAPTGWTKSTTHNDKTIRVTSGTGGGNGGSSSFSTVFSKTTTDATTLTTGTIPAHTHSYSYPSGMSSSAGLGFGVAGEDGVLSFTSGNTGSNGSGGSHTHPMDIRVHYLDVIICTKD